LRCGSESVSGKDTCFAGATFCGERADFLGATFSGERTSFDGATFSGGTTADEATAKASFFGKTVVHRVRPAAFS
jgi:uncharacterized protein YjbI with pentapeptide repeats